MHLRLTTSQQIVAILLASVLGPCNGWCQDANPIESSRDSATWQQLRQTTNFDFQDTPLDQALQLLSSPGVVFVIDRGAFDAVPLDPQIPVTIQLDDVPLETGLELMLRPMGLAFMVRNGVLVITPQDEAESYPMTRCFSVQSLIHPETEAAAVDNLIEIITSTVDVDSWRVNGGSGTITHFQGLLIVSNTYPVLRHVEDLIGELREHVSEIGGPKKVPMP